MTLNIKEFVDENLPDIRRYSIWSLKGVLSRCVEHSEKDVSKRDEIDRITAEEWIDKSPNIVRDLTEKYLLLVGYNKLVYKEGKDKIDIDFGGYISSDVLNTATNRLSTLSNDEFAYLIPKDFSEPDYRDRFLGRDVWDKFYQPLRNKCTDMCREFLYSKGYTRILFR